MRVACVLITHLRARVELRRQPHLRARPAVIADRSAGKPRVLDAFPAASGAVAGMTLDEALSRHPEATVLEADEPAYRREFTQALAALQGVSDRVEGAELGTAYAGLDGLESLHGGEAALVRALARGAPPRPGAADRGGGREVPRPSSRPTWTGRMRRSRFPPTPPPSSRPHPIDLLPLSRDAARRSAPLRAAHHGRRRHHAAGFCSSTSSGTRASAPGSSAGASTTAPWFPSRSRSRWSNASPCPSPPPRWSSR